MNSCLHYYFMDGETLEYRILPYIYSIYSFQIWCLIVIHLVKLVYCCGLPFLKIDGE